MARFSPPRLGSEFSCITSKEVPILGALVSNYFSDRDTYFSLFTFPDMKTPYVEEDREDDDGHLARTIGVQAAIRFNNAMARLQPDKIILAGLDDTQKSYIHAFIATERTIEINRADDLDAVFGGLGRRFEGDLSCRPSEVFQGLFVANSMKRRLHVDDSAGSLGNRFIHGSRGLIVVENHQSSDEIVAVNYAYSINADIVFVEPIERTERHDVQKLIYDWKNSNSEYSYQQLRNIVGERIKGINLPDYDFATFFTRGFPYGLVLNNLIPISHVFVHPGCDLFVLSNIGHELFRFGTGSALVFSPKLFGREETDDVIRMLEQSGYWVKPLLGPNASVNALANYGEYYPFDLMHICSHGGETAGYCVVQEFTDRNDQQHKIEYEEIVGFSPADRDRVLVARKIIFKKFDGFTWMSEELKGQHLADYIFEDMTRALRLKNNDDTTQRESVDTPIYSSCHIECSDSIHQGQFGSLACNDYPAVFNNTCSSWYEIALCFIAAGTRSYIGTLWKIDNKVAGDAARVFYKHALAGDNLLDAFYEMTRAVGPAKHRNVYLYWGLHFSTLNRPKRETNLEVFKVLVSTLAIWLKRYTESGSEAAKRDSLRVLRFLTRELENGFAPERSAPLRDEVAQRLSEDKNPPRGETEVSGDPFMTRGIIDL